MILFVVFCKPETESKEIRLNLPDPLFSKQWHIANKKYPQNDINVLSVWQTGNKGQGIRIAVIDDGVEMEHPDLKENIDFNLSVDFSGGKSLKDKRKFVHGAAVAGIIAAKDNNGVGITGVAPEAKIISYNLFNALSEENMKTALTKNVEHIDIMLNSWGAEDYTGQFLTLNEKWRESIEYGLKYGRNGRGVIYVWAAGNGADSEEFELDNSNYDGQANFYGVIPVCSVNIKGKKANYSEKGANLLVCAPSSSYMNGAEDGIVTTDLTGNSGINAAWRKDDLIEKDFTEKFGGTSASAAMAAGVIALILKENSLLSWRDVKLILAESARKNDPKDNDWQKNKGRKKSDGKPFYINHKYGFGLIDAALAVNLASNRQLLSDQKIFETDKDIIKKEISKKNRSITGHLTVNNSNISFIEFIEIYINLEIEDASNLKIILKGPSGVKSILAEPHKCIKNLKEVQCKLPNHWRFGSARNLGEKADGKWRLIVELNDSKDTAVLNSWRLKFYGH